APAAQLAKLKDQLTELRRQYSDRYPEVVRVQSQVAALEAQVAAGGTNGPTSAATPNRLSLVLMGFVAAFAFGVAAIVAAEKLDTTFHTAEDVQAFTNLPML